MQAVQSRLFEFIGMVEEHKPEGQPAPDLRLFGDCRENLIMVPRSDRTPAGVTRVIRPDLETLLHRVRRTRQARRDRPAAPVDSENTEHECDL